MRKPTLKKFPHMAVAKACEGGPEEELRKTAETCLQTVKEVRADVIVRGWLGFGSMATGVIRFFKENNVSCPVDIKLLTLTFF